MALDITVILIFIISTVRGRARGFAHILIRLLAWTAALILGVSFTQDVAGLLMATPVSDEINAHLTELAASGTFDITQYVPDFLASIIQAMGVQQPSQNTTHFTNAIINVMAFLLIVLATWIVASIIIRMISRGRREKTVFGRVDASVGMLLGAVRGVILVFLFLAFMFPLAGILMPEHLHAINESLNNSYIAGYLYDLNPLLRFIRNLPV